MKPNIWRTRIVWFILGMLFGGGGSQAASDTVRPLPHAPGGTVAVQVANHGSAAHPGGHGRPHRPGG